MSEELLTSKLSELAVSLRQEISNAVNGLPTPTTPNYAAGGTTNNIALSQIIDRLSGVTISNSIITGSTVDGYLPVTGGTLTGALTVTGATSTLSGLTLSNLDCTGFNNSGKLTTDAFGNIVCADDTSGSGSGSPGGSVGQIQYYDGGNFGASAGFTFNKLSGLFTAPQILATGSTTLQDFTFGNATGTNATTTSLFASSARVTDLFASTLTVSNLNGPLQANNGVVSATSSLGVLYGGTGLTTAPTYGQVLVGNSSEVLTSSPPRASDSKRQQLHRLFNHIGGLLEDAN